MFAASNDAPASRNCASEHTPNITIWQGIVGWANLFPASRQACPTCTIWSASGISVRTKTYA
jgi:hypothetical protein